MVFYYICCITSADIFCPGSYLCDIHAGVELRVCVAMHQVCDGKTDCPSGDDEIQCGKHYSFNFYI